MTPTKTKSTGASTGLVLLASIVTYLIAAPVAARAAASQPPAGPQALNVEISAPARQHLSGRAIPIRISCQPVSGPASACRTSLAMLYSNSAGRNLRVPFPALSAICHAGSDHAGRCWVPPGETTTFRRSIGSDARSVIRSELGRGPVQMQVLAKVVAASGAQGNASTTVELFR